MAHFGYEFQRAGHNMECGTALQRLFSTFANGWPGTGLLLLRISVFSYLIYDASARLPGSHIDENASRVVAALAGVFLIAGFWTPLAGAVAAIVELWLGLSNLRDFWPAITASAPRAPGLWTRGSLGENGSPSADVSMHHSKESKLRRH